MEVLDWSCGMTALAPTGSVGWVASAPRVAGAQDHMCMNVLWSAKRTILRFTRHVVCWEMGQSTSWACCIILKILL